MTDTMPGKIDENGAGRAGGRGIPEERPVSGVDRQKHPNQAIEIVEGRVREVPVSKHPVSTIPQTDVSWADIQRSKFNPWAWVFFVAAVLVAIVVPYWLGRKLALNHAQMVLNVLSLFTAQGVTFIAWMVAVGMLMFIGLSLVESSVWLFRLLAVAALAVEQLISGACVLKFNFWYSTRVLYSGASALPNAANLGTLSALLGVAVFAVVYVGLLVLIRPDSSLNALTHSWAAFLMFFIIEAAALLLAMFTGVPAFAAV